MTNNNERKFDAHLMSEFPLVNVEKALNKAKRQRLARERRNAIAAREANTQRIVRNAKKASEGKGRTSHADCDHESTPKARAACRKARNA